MYAQPQPPPQYTAPPAHAPSGNAAAATTALHGLSLDRRDSQPAPNYAPPNYAQPNYAQPAPAAAPPVYAAPAMHGGHEAYAPDPTARASENVSLSGIPDHLQPRPTNWDVPHDAAVPRSIGADPTFFRMTTNALPNTRSLAKEAKIPLGFVLNPFADAGVEVPLIGAGGHAIVRCRRCRTYVNPYVAWVNGGKQYRCNMCAYLNDIPPQYYCQLDATGRRTDAAERPELTKASVEYEASSEYRVREPTPPSTVFLIDVTYGALRSSVHARPGALTPTRNG